MGCSIKDVGKLIRSHREAAGLTQERLASKVGITEGYLSSVERGRKVPSLEKLFDLAEALEVRPADLMPGGERRGESIARAKRLLGELE